MKNRVKKDFTYNLLEFCLVLRIDLLPVLGAHQQRSVLERTCLELGTPALDHGRREDVDRPGREHCDRIGHAAQHACGRRVIVASNVRFAQDVRVQEHQVVSNVAWDANVGLLQLLVHLKQHRVSGAVVTLLLLLARNHDGCARCIGVTEEKEKMIVGRE